MLAVEGGEVNIEQSSHQQKTKTLLAITSSTNKNTIGNHIISDHIISNHISSNHISSNHIIAWTRPTKSHLWMYHTTSHNSNVVSYFHYMILTASILKYGDQILGLYNAVSPLLELLRHNRHHHQYHHDR